LFDQGFHGTAADGKSEEFGTFADAFCCIDIAVDIEGYHSAELFTEVLLRALMMWVRGETWKQDTLNAWVFFKPMCDEQSGLGLFTNAKLHGFDSAVQQVAFKSA
jgi:hypothetical protein